MSRDICEVARRDLTAITEKPCCRYAFLSGAIRGAGELSFTFKGFALEFRHTDTAFVEKIRDIVSELTGETLPVEQSQITGDFRKVVDYAVLRVPVEVASPLLEQCGIVRDRCDLIDGIPEPLIKKTCCKRAYLRGLFLACGRLSVPDMIDDWSAKKTKSGYLVEFRLNSALVMQSVRLLISKTAKIDVNSVLTRDRSNIVYVKSASCVSAILAATGSSVGMLALEEIILERQMKNDLNRVQNFDMANINKQCAAGIKQCRDIKIIDREVGIATLPESLAETCNMRLEYPDLPLEELGKKFDPPLSKSCINHRMRKLAEMAEIYLNNKE